MDVKHTARPPFLLNDDKFVPRKYLIIMQEENDEHVHMVNYNRPSDNDFAFSLHGHR